MRNFILSDFLALLGVPHTVDYTNRQFDAMAFKSLFGVQKVLETYGIASEGWLLENKEEIDCIDTPFIAHTPLGFTIVKSVTPGKVTYISQGTEEVMAREEFLRSFDGNVFLAFPGANSREPEYTLHSRLEFFSNAKGWLLLLSCALLFLYLFISNGIWRNLSTIFITCLDCAGLFFSWLLVQKTLKIKSKAADRMCGVLQEGGCDSILDKKVSKFFGLFSWSEVGFTYFSVSLLTLLIFPQHISYLAAINVLCLPYTVWSIWYQKFRAKAWCTLCVSVQTTLWLLFFSYLFGGAFEGVFPLRFPFFALGATYVMVLLALNRVDTYISTLRPSENIGG
ncbi:MAG: hypothetical protein NC204_04600 [Candidatus Amulumruptor caecigallinarius]|nr:hypothetical protein [Candidatus Amulumruptor caecigallinarius]